MLCPSCGYEMNENERFCNACGMLLTHGPKRRGESIRKKSFIDPLFQDAMDEDAEFGRTFPNESASNEATLKAAQETEKKMADEKAAKEAAERAAKEAAQKEAAANLAAVKERAAEEAVEKAPSDIERALKVAAKRTAAKKAAVIKAEAKRAAKKADVAKKAAEKASIEVAKKQVAAEETAAKIKAEEEAAARKAEEESAAKKAAEDAATKKASKEANIESASPTSHLSCKINGNSFPYVSITLDEGQNIFTQSDVVVWMSAGIDMKTSTKRDGSPFAATYTSRTNGQELSIASHFPGEIHSLDIGKDAVIVQKRTFLAAQPSAQLSAYVSMHLGGEHAKSSLDFRRLSGEGMAFIAIGGSLIKRMLQPGEIIKANTANIAAFEESVSFQTEIITEFQNTIYGGEGLFLSSLTGPGNVWIQTIASHV